MSNLVSKHEPYFGLAFNVSRDDEARTRHLYENTLSEWELKYLVWKRENLC